MFWGNYATLWWSVAGLFLFSILLVRVGLAHFRREELLGREIDVLNFRWAWGVFARAFKGDATNILDWYLREIPRSLSKIRVALLLTSLIAVAGLAIGVQLINSFQVPIGQTNLKEMNQNIASAMQVIPGGSLTVVLSIFWQNFRVVLLSLLMGAVSFGILGMIPMIASLGIVGYLMSLLSLSGLQPLQYLVGFILPHGIFEIPALLISTAAVLRGGALLATADENKNVGESFLESISEWFKLIVGIVIPLLLIAACVEVWITPRFAMYIIPLIP
jgi:uncharacterized membrane protein SpoIIM required for sporulation